MSKMPENSALTSEEEDTIENDKDELRRLINALKLLLASEKGLHVRTDDSFMLRYLRCSHYIPEKAFEKIKAYYTIKLQHPEWFGTSPCIEPHEYNISRLSHYILDDRDAHGKRIYINRMGKIDASKTTLQKLSQMSDLFLETILDEEQTQRSGIAIVVDMKNYSWSLLRWLTPGNVKIAVKKTESLPFKKLEYHVVNTSVFVNAALKLTLPFLSAKTKENIHFHFENLPSLHRMISPDVLPEEYGGNKKNLNIRRLIDNLLNQNKESLAESLKVGYQKEEPIKR